MTKRVAITVILLIFGTLPVLVPAALIDTRMTFQGSLLDAGVPADGTYDLMFQLWDGPDSGVGVPLGGSLSEDDVEVVDGVFTVYLDFGLAAFDGEARWIEVMVRDGASGGGFTALSPFVPVTAAPQAQWAVNAGLLEGMQVDDFALTGHAHAELSAGDGITGGPYDGTAASTFNVDFGSNGGQVAEGSQTVSIAAGSGLTGGISNDAIGDGVDGSLSVDFGATSGSVTVGNAPISILAGDGLTGGVSNDFVGDGVSASLAVQPGPGIDSQPGGVRARVDNDTVSFNGAQELTVSTSVIGDGLRDENFGAGPLLIGVDPADGIEITASGVAARVDGTSIVFNGSGELMAMGAGSPEKVAVVALAGGDYTSPIDAMNDRANWCGTASAVNPCLIRIMPGVYALPSALNLESYIDVEGSGPGVSILVRNNTGSTSAVVTGVNECADQRCELRDLSLHGDVGSSGVNGIYLSGADPLIRNVRITLTGTSGVAAGVRAVGSEPVLEHCGVQVAAGTARGIDASGGAVTVSHCRVAADGISNNQALYINDDGEIRTSHSRFEVHGAVSNSRAVFLFRASLRDFNSEFRGGPGTTEGAGIFAQTTSGSYIVSLDGSRVFANHPSAAMNRAIWGQSYTIEIKDALVQAISASGDNDAIEVFKSAVIIDDSEILAGDRPFATVGSTGGPFLVRISDSNLQSSSGAATVGGSNAFNVRVFHSQLSGGAASPFANCVSVLDENYSYFETTCP